MNTIGRFSVIALLIFLSAGIFFPQSSDHRERSNQLYDFFQQEGFTPQRQLLANSDQFPYSIILDFNQKNAAENNEIQRLILAISQETAEECLDEVLALAKLMENATAEVTLTLALLANESYPFSSALEPVDAAGSKTQVSVESRVSQERMFPVENQWHPTGSQILLENISTPDSCALVMLDGTALQLDQATVVFGSDGILTPLWLIQQVPLPVSQNFLITYRLNLAEDNPALVPFFRSGMATVAISFNSSQQEQKQKVFAAVKTMTENFSVDKSVSADSQNYIVLHFVENIWIGEQFSILVYLLITVLLLAIISGFSFLGKKGAIHRQAFFRIWYLIPITILLSTFFLWLGQLVAGKFVEMIPENTVVILGIKTLFSFVAVSLPFIFHLKFRLPIAQFVYGYLLTIVVAMNIFIFASIDLVLLFIFVLEYIIIYFSRLAKKIIPLIIASLIMLLPFIPYAVNILEYASQDKLLRLVQTGILGNMLYACILIPFQVMWLRIMVRIDIFGTHRHISSLKIVLATIGVMGIMVVCIVGTLFIGSIMLNQSLPEKELNQQSHFYQLVDAQAPEQLQVSMSRKSYLELQSVEVQIASPVPIIRYEVQVLSENQIPVYDSAMSFVTEQNPSSQNFSQESSPKNFLEEAPAAGATTHFLIPDYPTNITSFEYTADADTPQNIKVRLYLEVAPYQVALVERNFFFPALEGNFLTLEETR